MARTKLKEIGSKTRNRYIATVEKYGIKNGYEGRILDTILLLNIRLSSTNELITDHLWFTCGKQFKDLELKQGDVIAFNARVAPYIKGYQGHYVYGENIKPISTDYKLARPTKFEVISRVYDKKDN